MPLFSVKRLKKINEKCLYWSIGRSHKRNLQRKLLPIARIRIPQRKRRWYRKVCFFYKTFDRQSPKYLLVENLPSFKVEHYDSKTFFPSAVIEWNQLDKNLNRVFKTLLFRYAIVAKTFSL